MGTGGAAVAVLAGKYGELRPHLDERGWRLYLGSEARAYAAGEGCGLAAAVAVVAEAAGVSRATVMAGAGELAEGAEPVPGRARRPGAGRRKLEEGDPALRAALRDLLEASARGDPVVAVTWTTLSLREIVRQMAARGHRCEEDALARMMREDGYSLQGNSRVTEGRQHPDRDVQFRHINAMIAAFRAAGDPVVSVDAKKKEQLGPYWRAGRSWRRKGDPVRVRDHDFPDAALGKITPYGVYDITANTGFVSAGTSCGTAAFAVSALRLWWREQGAARYPGVRRLLVTCDAGGSSGYRCRLWKDQLARLAAETGLEITVCHFPPGTSKWNKIGHRLFCHITRTWRARPLMTAEDAVAGIAAATTCQGLKVTAVLDGAAYPDGVKISDERMKYLQERIVDRQGTRGEWNYTVRPVPRPGPEPEPEPGRGPDPQRGRPPRHPPSGGTWHHRPRQRPPHPRCAPGRTRRRPRHHHHRNNCLSRTRKHEPGRHARDRQLKKRRIHNAGNSPRTGVGARRGGSAQAYRGGGPPVPDSATAAGAVAALVSRVKVADLAPHACGENRTPTWQLAPGATGCWQRSPIR
jgi:Rhodopirellula transposase DDE domain